MDTIKSEKFIKKYYVFSEKDDLHDINRIKDHNNDDLHLEKYDINRIKDHNNDEFEIPDYDINRISNPVLKRFFRNHKYRYCPRYRIEEHKVLCYKIGNIDIKTGTPQDYEIYIISELLGEHENCYAMKCGSTVGFIHPEQPSNTVFFKNRPEDEIHKLKQFKMIFVGTTAYDIERNPINDASHLRPIFIPLKECLEDLGEQVFNTYYHKVI